MVKGKFLGTFKPNVHTICSGGSATKGLRTDVPLNAEVCFYCWDVTVAMALECHMDF